MRARARLRGALVASAARLERCERLPARRGRARAAARAAPARSDWIAGERVQVDRRDRIVLAIEQLGDALEERRPGSCGPHLLGGLGERLAQLGEQRRPPRRTRPGRRLADGLDEVPVHEAVDRAEVAGDLAAGLRVERRVQLVDDRRSRGRRTAWPAGAGLPRTRRRARREKRSAPSNSITTSCSGAAVATALWW